MKAKLGNGNPNDPLIITFEDEDGMAFCNTDDNGCYSINIAKQIIITPLQWEKMKVEANLAFMAHEKSQEGRVTRDHPNAIEEKAEKLLSNPPWFNKNIFPKR